jgi:hypothetical protein
LKSRIEVLIIVSNPEFMTEFMANSNPDAMHMMRNNDDGQYDG